MTQYDRTTVAYSSDTANIGTKRFGTGPFCIIALDAVGNPLINENNESGAGWCAADDADDGYNVVITVFASKYEGGGLDGDGNLILSIT